MPHGGPWARDYWGFNSYVQFFTTRCFAVLRVNFRGSSGYGRKHLLAGVKELGSLMIDDVADAARWATEAGYADSDSLAIFGFSYGGYVALMSAVRYQHLYQAAIAISAPSDIQKHINELKRKKKFLAYEFWKVAVGNPRKEYRSLREISPIFHAPRIQIPILAFHGENDGVVSADQTEQLEKELAKSEAETKVLIIKGEGHQIWNNRNISFMLRHTMEFLQSHLPAVSKVDPEIR